MIYLSNIYYVLMLAYGAVYFLEKKFFRLAVFVKIRFKCSLVKLIRAQKGFVGL